MPEDRSKFTGKFAAGAKPAGRVEPAPDGASREDHDGRAAALAPVAPGQDPKHRGDGVELNRPPLTPLTQTVAMEPEVPARWPARGVAGRASARAHLVHRRQLGTPKLDVELRLYDSNLAPTACLHRPRARRGACSNTLPAT